MKLVVRSLVMAAVLGAAGHAMAHEGQHDAHQVAKQKAPAAALKLETLLHQQLNDDFTKGREVVVSYVSIPPETTLPKHWHPGEEFIYCLEGEFELLIDGQDPIAAKAGDVLHVPYKAKHTAVTSAAGGNAVVFRVHTKGEPERILVEEK